MGYKYSEGFTFKEYINEIIKLNLKLKLDSEKIIDKLYDLRYSHNKISQNDIKETKELVNKFMENLSKEKVISK